MKYQILSSVEFQEGLQVLADRDPDLTQVILKYGPPPFWQRPPGFPTLVYIILEQQVSLASARAAYERLQEAASPLTPQSFLELDDQALKTIGFSRQKTAYCRELARSILEGHLDLAALEEMDDQDVRTALTGLKGIGSWTAEIYLLMALSRPDAWPSGDLALASAVQSVKKLPALPSAQLLDELGTAYQPWRAVAARIFWHYYLSRKGNGI